MVDFVGSVLAENNFPKVTDVVKNGKMVKFKFYRKKELWYETECGFLFPVPIDDTGDGQFNRDIKAITLMRWIRKAIKEIEKENTTGELRNVKDTDEVREIAKVSATNLTECYLTGR